MGMGYRSDVAMALAFDSVAACNQFIAENYEDWLIVADCFEDDSLSIINDKTVVFYVEWVKFYPKYSGPSGVRRLWNSAKAIVECSGVFVIVGEEIGDIEIDFFGNNPPWGCAINHTDISVSFGEPLNLMR